LYAGVQSSQITATSLTILQSLTHDTYISTDGKQSGLFISEGNIVAQIA